MSTWKEKEKGHMNNTYGSEKNGASIGLHFQSQECLQVEFQLIRDKESCTIESININGRC